MARPSSGFLFDLLAPRLFRPPTAYTSASDLRSQLAGPRQRHRGRGQASRGSATAAKAQLEAAEAESEEAVEPESGSFERTGRAWPQVDPEQQESNPAAGPSRWAEPSQSRRLLPTSAIWGSIPGHKSGHMLPPSGKDAISQLDSSADLFESGDASSPSALHEQRRAPVIPATAKSPGHSRSPLITVLSQPNPPRPVSLLPMLSASASRSDGDLLSRYARRLDDGHTDSAVKDMMGRMRLAPIQWISPSRARRKRRTFPRSASGTEEKGEELQPTDTPRRPLPPHLSDLRARTNAWARRMWPPRYLPVRAERLTDPNVYLCSLHYDLVYDPPAAPDFADALRALSSISRTTDIHRLSLLHLFLAYPSHPTTDRNMPVVRTSGEMQSGDIRLTSDQSEEEDRSHAPDSAPATRSGVYQLAHLQALYRSIIPTRQTLHLLVLQSLGTASLPPNPSPSSGPSFIRSGEARPGTTALISYFWDEWGFGPACETWRHIMRAAILADDAAWAKIAWKGWWSARERVMRRDPAFLEHDLGPHGLEEPGRTGNESGGTASAAATEGLEAKTSFKEMPHPATPIPSHQNASDIMTPSPLDDLASPPSDESGDISFRFEHRGRHLSRWIGTIRLLEKKGWIRRAEMPGETFRSRMSCKDAWDWVVDTRTKPLPLDDASP